jgi:NADH-quinone oxidoreductase subunit L
MVAFVGRLAIPSAIIGYLTIEPMLFKGWLDEAITVTSSHVSMVELKQQFPWNTKKNILNE